MRRFLNREFGEPSGNSYLMSFYFYCFSPSSFYISVFYISILFTSLKGGDESITELLYNLGNGVFYFYFDISFNVGCIEGLSAIWFVSFTLFVAEFTPDSSDVVWTAVVISIN